MTRSSGSSGVSPVGLGLGALALGVLGWLGYRAFSKPAPAASTATSGGDLSALPTFDPSSTDTEHAYMVSVFTTQPVVGMAIDPGVADVPPELAKDLHAYLQTLHIDHVVVSGPFESSSTAATGGIADALTAAIHSDPLPDLLLAVSMSGAVGDGVTKAGLQQLKDTLATAQGQGTAP